MKNKSLIIFTIFTLMLLTCTSSLAATISASKTTMKVVDKSICEINIKDIGKFTKELTEFNANKKEVTLTLTLENAEKNSKVTKPIELFLVLDNSKSMTETYKNKVKNQYVVETANKFTENLFNYFENIKIGIVGFSSIADLTTYHEGTLDDAKLLLNLSNSKDTIKNTISSYSENGGPRTNIEAGLSIAESNFSTSTECEKYIILISDCVPNLSLNTEHTMTYSGVNATNTKNKLKSLETNGYKIFSILMGSDNSASENPSAPIIDGSNKHMTYGELATEVFGTQTVPTAGKFYYIDYENLYATVNENIYQNIAVSKENSLKNIVIKDYFPNEIIENFNFEHVKSPNIGKVTTKVDSSDNSIIWEIELLKEGEIASLSYNLTLKDEYNAEIVKKILPTNEKVDINFETDEGKDKSSSDVSPKVQLLISGVPKDNTVSKDPIPQTGNYSYIFIILGCIIISLIIIKFRKLNNIK